MRRVEPHKIIDIIKDIISNDKIAQNGILEARALECWREVVGVNIAEKTQKITLRDGKIYVIFSSASARNEFFLKREYIKNEINHRVGSKVVTFIHVG